MNINDMTLDIFHFNDEEKQLHAYLARRGHRNTIISADDDPFRVVGSTNFDAAFIGLHPYGMRLMPLLKRRNRECVVTLITSDRNAKTAVQAMRMGAFDYLITPVAESEIERAVIMTVRAHETNLAQRQLEAEIPRTDVVAELTPEQHLLSSLLNASSLAESTRRLERYLITQAMQDTGGNVAQAARVLNISRTTFYKKLHS